MQKLFVKVFENTDFEVLCQPFGEYQTNCYLAIDKQTKNALIIDPGIGASDFVIQTLQELNATPLCILNTHGHFDHVWSNAELHAHFKIPLLCPFEDAFMLLEDCFQTGLPSSTPTLLIGAKENEKICKKNSNTENLGRKDSFVYGDFEITFTCYPGHTPGCSVIVLAHKNTKKIETTDSLESLAKGNAVMFSGDFIFKRSIGRSDFPYSSNAAMQASLQEFLKLKENMLVLPGHGGATSITQEQSNIPFWLTKI